jgi:hypothetical protein
MNPKIASDLELLSLVLRSLALDDSRSPSPGLHPMPIGIPSNAVGPHTAKRQDDAERQDGPAQGNWRINVNPELQACPAGHERRGGDNHSENPSRP